MKTSQSFGVYFTIKKEKAREGKTPVYACVTVNKDKCFIALKRMVEVSIWDFGKGAVKGNKPETKATNDYLDEVKFALTNDYQYLQLHSKLITPQILKSHFLGETKADEVFTLSRLMDYHHETATTSLKWSTLKHYAVTRRYLEKFLKEKFNTTDIFLHEIDYKFIKDFEVYLRNHKPKDHQQPLNNNGVMKHIIRVKKMVNLALHLCWVTTNPFAGYKLKMQKVNREHLTERELIAIENKDFTIERLDMVRDMFVFSCYTGLSYVDVANLDPTKIMREADGDYWVRTCREKTLIPVNVPLLPKAVKIYLKYKNHIRAREMGKVFPVISNQKVNSYLKEIADCCDVYKNITFHLARHTFATTVALSNGVPIETVSRILGHTKIATTQIYARVLERKISEDMNMLKKRIAPVEPPKRKAKRAVAD